ncbi:hypothetical protein ACS0TY_000225 [Phlomoides rotata]
MTHCISVPFGSLSSVACCSYDYTPEYFYPVCTTLGQPSSTSIDVLDKKNPQKGIFVNMTNSGLKHNCSLPVSVICNSNGVQGPQTLQNVGFCDYLVFDLEPGRSWHPRNGDVVPFSFSLHKIALIYVSP